MLIEIQVQPRRYSPYQLQPKGYPMGFAVVFALEALVACAHVPHVLAHHDSLQLQVRPKDLNTCLPFEAAGHHKDPIV